MSELMIKQMQNILSDYIDDLNAEKKPDISQDMADNEELQKLFETVRAVKRLRNEPYQELRYAKQEAKKPKRSFAGFKVIAVAAVFFIIFSASALFKSILPFRYDGVMEKEAREESGNIQNDNGMPKQMAGGIAEKKIDMETKAQKSDKTNNKYIPKQMAAFSDLIARISQSLNFDEEQECRDTIKEDEKNMVKSDETELKIMTSSADRSILLSSRSVVYSMTKAFQNLESYVGTIEIRSEQNGVVDFLEKIDVKYKKPNKFYAIHSYDGITFTKISDGEKFYTIQTDKTTIDYACPEKELWKYHICQQIEEFMQADEIKEIGMDTIAGRMAVVYEYRYKGDGFTNKLWVDAKTNIPLKNELNLSENKRLTNQFIQMEVNAPINDEIFSYSPKKDENTIFLNDKVELDVVKKDWPEINILLKNIPESFEFKRAVRLKDVSYNYLLNFKGEDEQDFLDVYIALKPVSDYYYKEADHGILGNGWVELEDGVVNAFKAYIGKSNVAKWVNPNNELLLVSNRSSYITSKIFEKMAEKTIKFIPSEALSEFGLEPVFTKENH